MKLRLGLKVALATFALTAIAVASACSSYRGATASTGSGASGSLSADPQTSNLVASDLSAPASASSGTAGPSGDAPKTVACIGDSITEGFGLNVPERTSWPALLQTKLGEGWNVVNLGVTGSTLIDEGGLPYRSTGNVERAKELNADVVIIMLGTNDAADAAWSEEAYRTQLAALVDELRAASHKGVPATEGAQDTTDEGAQDRPGAADEEAKEPLGEAGEGTQGPPAASSEGAQGPSGEAGEPSQGQTSAASAGTEFVLMAPPCTFFPPSQRSDYEAYNERVANDVRSIVKSVAEEKGARYLDLYALTESKDEWFPDFLHPNEAGTLAMANYIYDKLFA